MDADRRAVVVIAVIVGMAMAGACSSASDRPPVVGGLEDGGKDAVAETSVHHATCAEYGGKCTKSTSGNCPIQVTGIDLGDDDDICCAGYGDD